MSSEQNPRPYEQLQASIAAAQREDPFARCTIVVPHRAVSYDVMRRVVRNGAGGALNVRSMTLLDLARDLVEETEALLDREPLTAAAMRTAIEHELLTDPLGFREVADQPATLDALTRASVRLLRRERTPRDHLPPATADLLTIHERAMRALVGTYTAQDVFAAAKAQLDRGNTRERLGRIVLFQLPEQHDPRARAFVGSLMPGAEVIPLDRYDGGAVRERIDELISVTDPVEEVRCAVETVAHALAGGAVAAGNRIGIFFPTPDPYLGLLTAQLEAAGIAYTARGRTPVTAFAPARTLLRLLELDADENLDLRAVLDAHWEGALARPRHADPEPRLDIDRQQELPPLPPLPSSRALEEAFLAGADLSAADQSSECDLKNWGTLLAYRDALAARLRHIDDAPDWESAVERVRALYLEVIHRASAGAGARACHAAVLDALDLLAALGAGRSRPGREALAALLASELSGRSFREGTLSTGVTVGTHPSAVGRDLELVILLGMADGIAPAPSGIDALLPDEVCERFGGALLTSLQSRQDQRDQFAAAVAAGRTVMVTTPRGRLRSSGPLTLSPWIAPASVLEQADASARSRHDDAEGARLLEEFPGLAHLHQVTRVISSPLQAAREGYGSRTLPSTAARGWERAMLRVTGTAAAPGVPADIRHGRDRLPAFARLAREIRASRHQGTFTRFTGNLTHIAPRLAAQGQGFGVLNTEDAPPEQLLHVSATSLETWAQDPFSYFLEKVLRVELFAYPDEEEQAEPRVFGNIVHGALEKLVRAQLDTGVLPTEDAVEAVYEEVFTQFGRDHWSPTMWQVQQRSVRAMVERALIELRAGRTAGESLPFEPLAAESGFGRSSDQAPALRIPLDDGYLLLRGAVDRVDRLHDGSLRVIDYKTGADHSYKGISAEDPLLGSTRLQLPLYALHALAAYRDVQIDGVLDLPAAEAPLVEYHFLSQDPVSRIGYRWSPQIHSIFVQALRRITTLISAGVFPPLVQEPAGFGSARESWHTVMGHREQWRMHERMKSAGELSLLSDPTDEVDDVNDVEAGLTAEFSVHPDEEQR